MTIINRDRHARLIALYHELGGIQGIGAIPSPRPERSHEGTPYLTGPGVVLIAEPSTHVLGSAGLRRFLDDLDPAFEPYVDERERLHDGTTLAKMAGQLCYLSFGPNRTKNVDAEKYFENILSSGHGSVLEHANYSFLLYGVSRSFTHELVRHRAGCAYSQVSQRYVDKPRFVERAEYQNDPELHGGFEKYIDACMVEYDRRAERLMEIQSKDDSLRSASKTERRKKVNQSARECLPNETEAPIFFTANIRALRHVIGMRASKHADTQIREVFVRVFLIMAIVEPILFMDGEIETLPDGTRGVTFAHQKV